MVLCASKTSGFTSLSTPWDDELFREKYRQYVARSAYDKQRKIREGKNYKQSVFKEIWLSSYL